MKNASTAQVLLAAAVTGHLGVTILHGAAHDGAGIQLGPAANLFVLLVIVAGPVAGLLTSLLAGPRIGAPVIGTAMIGSFVFGVINHFLIVSPDHVAHVPDEWAMWFGTTAVLLAVTELIGALVAWWSVRLVRRTS